MPRADVGAPASFAAPQPSLRCARAGPKTPEAVGQAPLKGVGPGGQGRAGPPASASLGGSRRRGPGSQGQGPHSRQRPLAPLSPALGTLAQRQSSRGTDAPPPLQAHPTSSEEETPLRQGDELQAPLPPTHRGCPPALWGVGSGAQLGSLHSGPHFCGREPLGWRGQEPSHPHSWTLCSLQPAGGGGGPAFVLFTAMPQLANRLGAGSPDSGRGRCRCRPQPPPGVPEGRRPAGACWGRPGEGEAGGPCPVPPQGPLRKTQPFFQVLWAAGAPARCPRPRETGGRPGAEGLGLDPAPPRAPRGLEFGPQMPPVGVTCSRGERLSGPRYSRDWGPRGERGLGPTSECDRHTHTLHMPALHVLTSANFLSAQEPPQPLGKDPGSRRR